MSEATYGQQIVAARQEMRITQKELAARVGISQQYLCDIEHDRRDVSPSGAVAEAIAYHAGVRSWTPGERALAARVADLEAALAEAIDTWTPLARCDSMQEGDELTAFEARAGALLAGPGGATGARAG